MEPCTFRPKLEKIKKIRFKKVPYIWGNGTLQFLSPGSKNRKNLPWEKFLYSGEIEISGSNISGNENPNEKFYFLKRKLFLYFRKWNFIIQKMETLKNFYILASNFSNSKNKKNALLKGFLYFGKWNFLVPCFKNSCFFRTPCGFSSLFLQVFYFITDFCYCFSGVFILPTFSTMTVFCHVLRFCVVPRVLRIGESFFNTQAFFTLHFFPTFGTTCFYQRLPRELAIFPWRLKSLPLRFETKTRPPCLFESQSAQLKVLVGRFYLCIKDLRNTISTSSRFWTHYLIAIYIVKHESYPLDHRSSCWLLIYKCI